MTHTRLVEYKTRTYHEIEGARQNETPTRRFAQDTTVFLALRRIKDTGSGLLFRSTNNANRWKTDRRRKPAVYQRFISVTRSALCSWLLANVTSPICLCIHFLCNACAKNIQQAGRVGAAHSEAAERGGARHDGPTYRFAYENSVSRTRPGIGFTCGQEFCRSTKKVYPRDEKSSSFLVADL